MGDPLTQVAHLDHSSGEGHGDLRLQRLDLTHQSLDGGILVGIVLRPRLGLLKAPLQEDILLLQTLRIAAQLLQTTQISAVGSNEIFHPDLIGDIILKDADSLIILFHTFYYSTSTPQKVI